MRVLVFILLIIISILISDFIHHYLLVERYRLSYYRTYCVKEILDERTFIACPQGYPKIEGRFTDSLLVKEFQEKNYCCFSVDSSKYVTDYQTTEDKTNNTK